MKNIEASSFKFKNVFLINILIVFVLLFSSCENEKQLETKYKRFGMDLADLHPMVIWVENEETGEIVFSRDPSNVSAVINLFEKINMQEDDSIPDKKGYSFVMSTIYGFFDFGTSIDDSLFVNGDKYKLDKDYTSEMDRLFQLIKSESDFVGVVDLDKINKINPDMTYQELFDLFGEKKDTSVIGTEKASLYQYKNYGFFIRFVKLTDKIGITPSELIKNIFYRHNLEFSPDIKDKIDFDYNNVYKESIIKTITEFRENNPFIEINNIIINSKQWIGVSVDEAAKIKQELSDKLSVAIKDTESLSAYANGELLSDFMSAENNDTLIIAQPTYSFVRKNKTNIAIKVIYYENKNSKGLEYTKNFKFEKLDSQWKEK